MSDDYFSFMSDKGVNKHAKQRHHVVARPAKSLASSGRIKFAREPQIEVTESIVGDSTIQRIFRRWSRG